MTIETLLSGLKPITAECFHVFAPFYAERAKHYVYPLFYQSITEMISSGSFFYKIFGNDGRRTLAIFKAKTVMGRHSLCLHIAPISLTGCAADEAAIMQECRKRGLTMKVCLDDIKRYHIPMNICNPISGNVEYIYNATKISALEGGEFHTFRRCLRAVQRHNGYKHVIGATAEIEPLVRAWDTHNKERGKKGAQTNNWKRIWNLNNPNVVTHSIFTQDRIEAFSVIERLTPKHWVLVMGVRNYTSPLNDINKAMHILDCQETVRRLSGDCQETVYANLGAAIQSGGGLEATKENLHPCRHQQIYKINPATHLTQEELCKILKSIYRQ